MQTGSAVLREPQRGFYSSLSMAANCQNLRKANPYLKCFVAVLVTSSGASLSYSEIPKTSSGLALLVTYPDYPVNTNSFYGYTKQVGHAGVLIIRDDGLTKYYEFGRYDSDCQGQVRRQLIPNVHVTNGSVTTDSLLKVLKTLSVRSGKGGRIRAACFVNMNFAAMNAFASTACAASSPGDPAYDYDRKGYNITSYNCGHFAEQVILTGHPRIDRPITVNPTPNNLVDEYIEEGNAEALYRPRHGSLTIGPSNESDAKE